MLSIDIVRLIRDGKRQNEIKIDIDKPVVALALALACVIHALPNSMQGFNLQ